MANELALSANSSYVLTNANVESNTDSVGRYNGDIYYIVLDGYGGNEVLTKFIKLDNTPFYRTLEERGFVISYNSRSNYIATIFSLASTLNMTYLDPLVQVYGENFTSVLPLREYIYNSEIFKDLKRYKYKIVMITSSSHLNPGRNKGLIDEFITYTDKSPYFISVYSNTFLRYIFRANLFYPDLDVDNKPWIPESIDWVFNRGLALADNKRKDFVFMHILSPHEPYYFNQYGEIAIDNRYKSWNGYKGPFDPYRDTYAKNLLGLNKKIEAFLNRLQNRTNEMPIVILQGDHGPPEIAEIVLKREAIDLGLFKTSILNAFLLPNHMRNSIQDGMTPVNSFRVILKHVTGNEIELLENKSYGSDYKKPFQFRLIHQAQQ